MLVILTSVAIESCEKASEMKRKVNSKSQWKIFILNSFRVFLPYVCRQKKVIFLPASDSLV